MIRYWTQFAHTSTPNGAGTPTWPRFKASSEQVQSLAPGPHAIRQTNLDRTHNCTFWHSL